MSETYEAIGIAVRQHDAIRLSIVKGMQATFFIAAESVRQLFGRRTVPIYRLRLAGDYVTPEPTGEAALSASGKTVLLRIAGGPETVMIPTRQLQVHYDRNLGETAKIIRAMGAPAPALLAPLPGARLAVV
ncbi:MAG TPA: hypothetical protein PLY91_07655 [Methanoregulaceae archaeon]|nr:hypothetical protein [Methanoregulaceae archaeon]